MAQGRAISDDQTERFLIGLRRGMTVKAAAGFAGFNRASIYRRIQDDASLATEVEKAIDSGEAYHTNVVFEAAEKNWQASAWWLERRMYSDYARRDKVEMSIDLRTVANRIAEESELDPDEVIAAAERVIAGDR